MLVYILISTVFRFFHTQINDDDVDASAKEVMYSPVSVCLFVCLFVREQDYVTNFQAVFVMNPCWIVGTTVM